MHKNPKPYTYELRILKMQLKKVWHDQMKSLPKRKRFKFRKWLKNNLQELQRDQQEEAA